MYVRAYIIFKRKIIDQKFRLKTPGWNSCWDICSSCFMQNQVRNLSSRNIVSYQQDKSSFLYSIFYQKYEKQKYPMQI
jgi:hypothetical protein